MTTVVLLLFSHNSYVPLFLWIFVSYLKSIIIIINENFTYEYCVGISCYRHRNSKIQAVVMFTIFNSIVNSQLVTFQQSLQQQIERLLRRNYSVHQLLFRKSFFFVLIASIVKNMWFFNCHPLFVIFGGGFQIIIQRLQERLCFDTLFVKTDASVRRNSGLKILWKFKPSQQLASRTLRNKYTVNRDRTNFTYKGNNLT